MTGFAVKDVLHYCNILAPSVASIFKQTIDFYDFTFVISGSMTYTANGRCYVMKKNDAILLPPGCVRARYATKEPTKYVSFNFTLKDGITLPFPEFMEGCITKDIKSLVNVFPQSHLYPNYHSKEKLESILNYILYELLDVTNDYTANEYVSKIIRIIELEITEKLSLSAISERIGLTKEYTASLFKRETGKTMTQYINERKLLHARELIITAQIPLSDISRHLGYDNYTYFSRLFKQYFGFSPKQLLSKASQAQ